ncbi:MAG: Gx transporter family protein [Bacilli bacterium]
MILIFNMRRTIIKKISLISLLAALAIVLSIAESFISLGIPGVKLGLANVVIIIALYAFNFWYALGISILRVFVTSLCLGTIFQMGFFMSLTGSILSLLIMLLFKKVFPKFSVVGVSTVGSIFHVTGQIIIATIYMGNLMFYYYPLIFVCSIVTGVLTGIIALNVMKLSIFKNWNAPKHKEISKN